MKKVYPAVALALILGCSNVSAGAPNIQSLEKGRTRIVGIVAPKFNTQAISHPSGGWPVSYLISETKMALSASTWKVRVVVDGVVNLAEYPRKSNSLVNIPVFRTRYDAAFRRHDCLTQTFSGVALVPNTEATFILDMSKFASGDSIVFEHYRGYSIYLDAYDSSGNKLSLNGGAGLMMGPTPEVPERMQFSGAIIDCN